MKGNDNVPVFFDLDAGDIGYELSERGYGAAGFGLLLQGLNEPANDLLSVIPVTLIHT
jgi:phosphotransacetylase